MSRLPGSARRPGWAGASVLIVAALLVVPASARAQEGSDALRPRQERIREVQARIDSLAPLRARAEERVRQVEAATELADKLRVLAGTDTVRVGPLRVLVLEGQGELARRFFGPAWEAYRPMVGDAVPPELEKHLFALQYGFEIEKIPLPERSTGIFERRWRTPEGLVAYRARAAVGQVLYDALEGPGKQWFGGPLQPAYGPGDSYRRLLLTPSRAARGCLAGDLAACWASVGATGTDDELEEIRIWFDEGERIDAVRRWVTSSMPFAAALRAECLELRIMESCERALVPLRDNLAPLREASDQLLHMAIEMGGAGAYGRLAEASRTADDLKELVSRTADLPADRVMAEWHRRVVASKPRTADTGSDTRFATFLWVVFFAALATRSTRWRSG